MCSQILNTIGLFLDIIGAIMLFYYFVLQSSFEEGVSIGLEDANVLNDGKTVAEHREEVRKNKAKYSTYSRLAMIFIAIGFAFQLLATWVY